jgi:intracellular septation protein A
MTTAVIVTILICAALFVSWVCRPQQKTELGTRMLLIAYALMGAWTLWFVLYSEPGLEPSGFKFWKPTVLYWTLATILFVAPPLGWGYPVKAIFGSYFSLPNKVWQWINNGVAGLCAFLGGVNLLVAYNTAEGNWTGHKFSTLYLLLFLILFRMGIIWLPTMASVAFNLYRRVKAFFL